AGTAARLAGSLGGSLAAAAAVDSLAGTAAGSLVAAARSAAGGDRRHRQGAAGWGPCRGAAPGDGCRLYVRRKREKDMILGEKKALNLKGRVCLSNYSKVA